jgi:hypothetical protein
VGIFQFDPGKHRFAGLRVRRVVAGETRSRHFSFRATDGRDLPPSEQARLREQAERLDAAWAAEQKQHRRRQAQEARPRRSGNNTGVAGLTFEPAKERRKGQRTYRYPAFVVNARSPDGRVEASTFVIAAGSDPKEAWRKACNKLAKIKQVDPAPWFRLFPAENLVESTQTVPERAGGRTAARIDAAWK